MGKNSIESAYKILNTSDFLSNSEIKKRFVYYKEKYDIEYFELIKYTSNDNLEIKDIIKGLHLRFFPSWIDLYFKSEEKLLEELGNHKNIKSFCGGITKEEMLSYYRAELDLAQKMEVEYVVLHPCNVNLFECMTYEFKYSNMEILEKVVDIINQIFDENKYSFKLLLENVWWSGLTLTSYDEVDYLIKSINYKNVGFMLDMGHMINTNLEIRNSDEAIDYIEKNLEKLKEYSNYIYGVHLNYSLSGEYTKQAIKLNKERKLSINTILSEVYDHVFKIDSHNPFENMKIKKIINSLPIKYLVFEFLGETEEKVEEKLKKQLKYLK